MRKGLVPIGFSRQARAEQKTSLRGTRKRGLNPRSADPLWTGGADYCTIDTRVPTRTLLKTVETTL